MSYTLYIAPGTCARVPLISLEEADADFETKLVAKPGAAMLLLADGVTTFLQKNRMYEVLGLFILLIVGVVLLGEAGPAAAHAMHDDSLQIRIFGQALLPMSKTTFYFSVLVLVAV